MSKQHCRLLQCRMLLRHCCRFWQQCRSNVRLCCQKQQQCRTSFAFKFRLFDKVERFFDNVAQNGNIVEATGNCCFNNVASTLLLVWTELYRQRQTTTQATDASKQNNTGPLGEPVIIPLYVTIFASYQIQLCRYLFPRVWNTNEFNTQSHQIAVMFGIKCDTEKHTDCYILHCKNEIKTHVSMTKQDTWLLTITSAKC